MHSSDLFSHVPRDLPRRVNQESISILLSIKNKFDTVARDICSSQLAIEVTRVKLSLARLSYIRISRLQIGHYESVVL